MNTPAETAHSPLPFVWKIQCSFNADDAAHHSQVLGMFRQSEGVELVRDLHNEKFKERRFLSCAYWPDMGIPVPNLPDGMKRVLCPSHWFPVSLA